MTHKLIVFDIDGTLTKTNDIDSLLFEKSILEVLPIHSLDTNWANYKYSTDAGILAEITQSTLNRNPHTSEVVSIKTKFFSYLASAFANHPSHCLPIHGAKEIFQRLSRLGWDIAIATGGWKTSALLKLRSAQIPYQAIPIAHSDDHVERRRIISLAIERSQKHYNKPCFKKIIYVGDRLWDERAAMDLGIDFLGIGDDLGSLGNRDFFHISDYADARLEDHLRSLTHS
ncbi:MAG: HAD family hydrolase [Gammaproteobacteria bacterium]|nr:HAD family hydrolase [Gammaproteobacteria bacterium]